MTPLPDAATSSPFSDSKIQPTVPSPPITELCPAPEKPSKSCWPGNQSTEPIGWPNSAWWPRGWTGCRGGLAMDLPFLPRSRAISIFLWSHLRITGDWWIISPPDDLVRWWWVLPPDAVVASPEPGPSQAHAAMRPLAMHRQNDSSGHNVAREPDPWIGECGWQNRNFDPTTWSTTGARMPRGASCCAGIGGPHRVLACANPPRVFQPRPFSVALRTGPVSKKCLVTTQHPDCPPSAACPQSRSCRWPRMLGEAIWRNRMEGARWGSMFRKAKAELWWPPALAGGWSSAEDFIITPPCVHKEQLFTYRREHSRASL